MGIEINRPAEVAQVSNLLCRRLPAFAARHSAASARRRPVGRAWEIRSAAVLEIEETVSMSPRYGTPSAHGACRLKRKGTTLIVGGGITSGNPSLIQS